MSKEKNEVVSNALSMAMGTMSSRVLGLLREIMLTSLFPRFITDAWTVAFRLPNIFRRILGEGSLSVSFIPIFVEAGLESPERARNVANGVYTVLLLVLGLITALGLIYIEPLLRLMLDENFYQIADKMELTVRMSRLMFGFIFLVCTYAFFMGILNALGSFALAAMAPTLFNISMIISTLLPSDWFSSPGDGLALGVLIGGFLQLGILVPALKKKNYLPQIQWKIGTCFQNKDVQKVFRHMVPGLFGLGLLQMTTLINQKFASELGEGAITYIYLADRLLELPLSLISVSLGTALLPTLSGFWSRQEKDKMSETLSHHLQLNLFLVFAAALGLFVLAQPIVEVLFERGKFGPHDVAMTVQVLQVWALIMIPSSLVRVFAPAYYSVKNTWFPALVSLICLILHILVAPVLMEKWGLRGLNISSLLSSTLNVFLLLIFYSRIVHSFSYLQFFKKISLFLIPLVGMGIVLSITNLIYQQVDFFLMKVLVLGVLIAASLGAYFWIGSLLKIHASQEVTEILTSKIKRRLNKSKPS